MFTFQQLKTAGKNSLNRQLLSNSNDYSNIYLINSNDSRPKIKDTIVRQLEGKPERVVMWSFSSPEMCKLCPRGLDVQNKNLRKSENEFGCADSTTR